MTERDHAMTGKVEAAPVDRRAFLGMTTMAASACAVLYALPSSAATARMIEPPFARQAARKPVGTVFMDMPYVDMTGLAEPYVPPKTVSPGQPQAHFAWDYQWAFQVAA